jgi:hypothetical protein
MTNQDREVFEQVAGAYFPHGVVHPALHRKSNDGEYFYNSVSDAWRIWQAAKAHYTPKANDESYTRGWNEAMDYAAEANALTLVEEDAVDKTAKALAKIDCSVEADLRKVFGEQPEDEALCVNSKWAGYIPQAKAALRAAGVRFKEEA